jgi:hypothetical protein
MHVDTDFQNIPTANTNQALKSNIHSSGDSLHCQDTTVFGIFISLLTFPGFGIRLQIIRELLNHERLAF